ncbi:Glutamate-ammonia-ligase adenylyltransferase [Caulifigura coniformis]|uniref:Glutamate-ammonia-ligase adenylyltransferase n=1 Tax=Caulifigura coniformis TaxID=2527983 RepID=A0A517SCA0_9PLAN|nr:glutamine synthetase adenylyltransferase [Caulifigura coniformis]QDT53751.1 Glutamate-ammonia-ligase adenylyltransferase [Caulifigura coniformis]
MDVAPLLLSADPAHEAEAEETLRSAGFLSIPEARARFRGLARTDAERELFARALPGIVHALADGAVPDTSLINLERFVQAAQDSEGLFRYLAENPRAVEILFRLFVGSQFLTEILLRNPHYLERLTQHKRLADFKSRTQFVDEEQEAIAPTSTFRDRLDELRRYQQWELLRLAACDTFGLMDLKSATLQLALLADSLVQSSLDIAAAELKLQADDFSVLAFGKLGGEELNYSSDIDLVFVCQGGADRYWGLGQKLINAISEPTSAGFLYRVDMRLRPWGSSGPLVSTSDAYVDYLKKHGRLWEKQALLKARVIAGNHAVGNATLKRLEPFIFEIDAEAARANVADMKQKIEQHLAKRGKAWGEVKGGQGSIRDVEFVVQYLQLANGHAMPEVRSFNTLDALVRLAEFDLLRADEFRQLSSGYVFLRTIEHSLQLMHNKQEHSLPESPRELAYLARRLDYPNADVFLSHYTQHCRAIRAIYEKYILRGEVASTPIVLLQRTVDTHFGLAAAGYREIFNDEQAERHLDMLDHLDDQKMMHLEARPSRDGAWELTVVGYDVLGNLSLMCGLLFVWGWNIESGWVFTGAEVFEPKRDGGERRADERRRKYVNVFTVRPVKSPVPDDAWTKYSADLNELLRLALQGKLDEAQGKLAKRVARALRDRVIGPRSSTTLLPVEIDIDNEADPECTVMHIEAEDTIGFLYELTNSLSVSGVSIHRVRIQSNREQALDTLAVVGQDGKKITDPLRLSELRAAVVLTKHFTHLLPQSPNPESALVQFRQFLEHLFQQPNWLEQLASLQQTEVLAALAQLLGVSEFLWHDFLRLQHENLFPVVANVEGLRQARPLAELNREVQSEMDAASDLAGKIAALNAFKDREMLRVDMRHILNLQDKFVEFSRELTEVAEAVVTANLRLCEQELQPAHGSPEWQPDGKPLPSRLALCALGKFGGYELGYASDIELMFVYEADGRTSGPNVITNAEYYQKIVDLFRTHIHAKRKGIFEVDLRLRPYGKAGSLAVSLETFRKYFSSDGPAWPYERQALVKLRPVSGDGAFGRQVVEVRDELIYTGRPFDVAAMRGMREKQNRQLVRAGTFNAKLSPGGLVDCEYLVQGLQITYGHRDESLRATNTRTAMKALQNAGILASGQRVRLRDAYRFWRRVIDGLRMVRGDARDLAVPARDTEEFEFLARRLEYGEDLAKFERDLERNTRYVLELSQLLESHAGTGRRASGGDSV